MNPLLIAALLQGGVGLAQTIFGSQKQKNAMQQRTAFQTPEQDIRANQLAENLAGQGYDAFTLNFLKDQISRSFNKSAGVAERLGANPNDLSSIFDQSVNDIMKVGAENHAQNMNNINRYLSTLTTLGQDAAAEWKSQQDLLKDKQQAGSAEEQAGFQNILGGINTGIAGYSNAQMAKLFTKNQTFPTGGGSPQYSTVPSPTGISLPTVGTPNFSTSTVPATVQAAGVYGGINSASDAFVNALMNAKNNNGINAFLQGLFP